MTRCDVPPRLGSVILAVSVAATAAGCKRDQPSSRPPPDAAPSASAEATGRPHLAALPPGPWRRAAAGDELARRRLATDLSAEDLLEVAVSDAEPWPVALAAIAETRDADLAFARLAAFATADPERRRPALEALVAIANRRPRPVEPWDPPGVAEGAAILDRLSRDPRVARADRARAISALRGLARSGRWAGEAIDASLDPGLPRGSGGTSTSP